MLNRIGVAALALVAVAAPVAPAHAADFPRCRPMSLDNLTPCAVTPAEHAQARPGLTRLQVHRLYGMPGGLSARMSGRVEREVRIYPCAARDGGQTYVYFRLVDHHWRVQSITWFGR